MPCDGVVVVTTRTFATGEADDGARLRAHGLRVVRGDVGHDLRALSEPLADAVAWIAGTSPIGPAHLAAAPGLRVIARYGTGTDTVDVEAAAARGVVVTNTPAANADSVADHAVALMLAALRHVVSGDHAVRRGDWSRPPRGRELGALTVGIVGFGHVGRRVAGRVSHGFGARAIAHDPFCDDAHIRAGAATPTSLEQLVSEADVVSLHLPGDGAALVDEQLLRRFRRGAVLINTARGSLLDEEAVAAALRSGALSAVAVDVLASEPPAASPLLDAPNVTVTPHAAASTTQAIDRMSAAAVDNVLRVLCDDERADRVRPAEPTP